jgi:hypothetical protein
MKTLGLAAFDYVLSCRTPAPPGDRLQAGRHARIRFQVEIRAGNCELWSPLWRVVMRGSAHSPDIAQRAEAVRSLSRARIELMYGAELATLTDHDRRAMVGLIESIQDYESWGRLRTTYRLSFADVCAAWVTAIDRLLPATPATAAAKQM